VVIDRVMPGSSADQVGLEGIDYRNRLLGDVILTVDGQAVNNIAEFVRLMQRYDVGQSVILKVRRADQVREVTVKIMDIS
jgi:2-alkenal reductase